VARNRARRLLREGWRQASSRLNGDWDVVLVARPPIVGAGAREVAADLFQTLSSAGAMGG
jgi:ribonuclease P protein component